MNDICAIIVAGGKGKRMGAGINKQFLMLKDKPVLYYTLRVFSLNRLINSIILVSAKDEIDYCRKEIIKKYDIDKVINVVAGGKERQESVYNGLCAAKGSRIVLIHDGARPFIDDRMIEEGIKYAEMYGACSCGVSPKDTIKVRNSNCFSQGTLDRESLFCIQTPQCFKYDLIMECHRRIKEEEISVTDDTMVVERYNNSIYLYDGSYNNIKITTPEDMAMAKAILCDIK
jgi:2-C-methyl-D-erythritol 4-phosphate cytidylyltransferase